MLDMFKRKIKKKKCLLYTNHKLYNALQRNGTKNNISITLYLIGISFCLELSFFKFNSSLNYNA